MHYFITWFGIIFGHLCDSQRFVDLLISYEDTGLELSDRCPVQCTFILALLQLDILKALFSLEVLLLDLGDMMALEVASLCFSYICL